MANILEYTLSLHDKMSATLSKIGVNSEEALEKFAKLEKTSKAVQRTMTAFGGSIGALKGKLEHLRNERDWIPQRQTEAIRRYNIEIKKLEKEISKLEHLNGGKLKQWREDFASSMPGANLIKNPLVMAGAAVTGMWAATQKAMDAGKEKIKLQTLTGSKEIGESLYKGLTTFATDTVFGSEVYDMGVQMLANGIQDTDVMPLMNMLGDISMGDSDKLGQLSLAFAQISGKGKLAGQELLQMINAGFNPLQVISEKTGESMASLQEKMGKGTISVQQVRWAMEQATGPGGKFNNMLQDVANTPYGQLENLKGQFDQLVISLGETFLPVASRVMSFFSWLGEQLGPLVKPVGAILAALSVGLLALAAAQWVVNLAVWSFPGTWIVLAVIAIAGAIWAAIDAYDKWGKILLAFMGPLGWTVIAIVEIARGYDRWGAAILQLLGPIGWLINFLVQIYRHWQDIKNAFKVGGILEGLRALGNTLLRSVLDPIKQILSVMTDLPFGIGNVAQSAIDGINKIEGRMDARDSHNRYLAAVQETKEKIKAADHQKYLDALQETKDKIAGNNKIAPAGGVPGASTGALGGGGGGRSGGAGSRANEAIATGGTKSTVVNVTIQRMLDGFKIMVNDTKEGISGLEDRVIEAVTRAVAAGASLGAS